MLLNHIIYIYIGKPYSSNIYIYIGIIPIEFGIIPIEFDCIIQDGAPQL